MTHEVTGRPSTPSLVADALAQMTTLFETEIRLLRTELGEKVGMAFRAVAVMMVAAVLLLAALILLLISLVEVLVGVVGLAPYLAYFAVGVAILLCGGIALFLALRSLSVARMMPERTFVQLGKDAEIVKEQVR